MKSPHKALVNFLALFVSDLVAVFASVILGQILRATVFPRFLPVSRYVIPLSQLQHFWFLLLLWPLVFAYEGLYRRKHPTEEEALLVLRGSAIATLLAATALFYIRGSLVSRLLILEVFILSALLVPLFRSITKRLLILLGTWQSRALVLGMDRFTRRLVQHLQSHPELGYQLVGVVAPAPGAPCALPGLPCLGTLDQLPELLEIHRPEALLVSGDLAGRTEVLQMLESLAPRVQEVILVPDLRGLRIANMEVGQMGSVAVLKLRQPLLTRPNLVLKRLFDLVVASLSLLVLLPVFVVIALAIKLTSRGPVFYVQPRVGLGGKVFPCYKFRTMYLDSEERLERMLRENPEARRQWETYRKLPNDPRVTPVGRFLRRYSLDELPQLWNVLRGDMSLVGPRPYLESELPHLSRDIRVITSVKPGITGLWQVSGRSKVPFEERSLLDEYYVRNWSLWLDLMILIKTLWVILKGEGAY